MPNIFLDMKIAIPAIVNKLFYFLFISRILDITAKNGQVMHQKKISMEKLNIPRFIEKLALNGL